MSFHVGQKVVCVKPGYNPETWAGINNCVVGAVYTVRAVIDDEWGAALLVEEIVNPIWRGLTECGFYRDRFRPIQERKIDIGFAHEILRKVTRKNRVSA